MSEIELPVVFAKGVLADVNETYCWYETERENLGDEFLAEIDAKLRKIKANPLAYASSYRGSRAAPVDRFPYVIYFRVHSDRIEVFAIQHGKRHPARWKMRAR